MTRPFIASDQFKLGLFSANCSGGMAVTKIPERWSASWEDNLKLARLADEVGIDFLLPIARWIGYKGETNFHGSVLDPVAWATGLLAATKDISVFATVHTAFNHPIAVAKQLATVDQIGGGRAGLNIVAGWNQPEYETFGLDLPAGHDERYALAQEWWDVVRRAWTDPEIFDHHGAYYDLQHIESLPKPVEGILPILNAGSSVQGRDFAARNSDFVFTSVIGPEDGKGVVEGLKQQARSNYDRKMGVLTFSFVVCRSTKKEAEDYLRYYAEENADWEAVDYLMKLQGLHAQSFTKEMLDTFRPRFAAGHGGVPLVGTPDDVAREIKRYYDAGFAGLTLSFVDYVTGLDYFAQEVIPRLEALGVRKPKRVLATF
ncbi:MAG: LLM class flavin-dependent oxidoreductase [Microbacteriaceae bacterium]